MKLTERIPLVGILKISKIFPDGREEIVFNEKNVITLTSKQNLLAMLYTPALTSDPIDRLRVGTGGTVDPEGLFPKTEDQTQSNLNTPLLTVTVSDTVDNTVPEVVFLADVDQSTGNGSLISEAGLLTTSGVLFNVKNFPGIPKTSEFSLHVEWTIRFA